MEWIGTKSRGGKAREWEKAWMMMGVVVDGKVLFKYIHGISKRATPVRKEAVPVVGRSSLV